MKEPQEFPKPPAVFLIPFTIITVPAFVIGTIFSFAKIGFITGLKGVEHIYFAKQRAEWEANMKEKAKRDAEEVAKRINEHLKELGHDGTCEIVEIKKEKDGEQ